MQSIRDHINILLPITVVFAMGMRLMPELEFLYYPTPILLGLFIAAGYDKVFQNRSLKILSIMFIAFGVWAIITSLWSDYPLFSLTRGGYFILLALGSVCGISLWSETEDFQKNPFGFLLPANLFVLVTSLISLISGWPKDAWTGGNLHGFMGIFSLQLALGRALLFTFPALLYILFKYISSLEVFKKENLLKFLSPLVIILLNFYIIIISHSRAVLLSLAVGILFSFILFFNTKQRIHFTGGLLLIVVVLISIPSLSTKIKDYTLKGTSHITANREILWGPSYEAAKIGGLFGIGYGTSATEIETQFQFVNNEGRLRREKGNGILALIEEVGIIGLLLFMAPLFYVCIKISKNWKSKNLVLTCPPNWRIVNCSFLIAFFLHSQFEDWMVGMGEFSLLIFLMFLVNTVKSDQ